MRDHKQMQQRLRELAAGTLDPAATAELRRHLVECGACAQELKRWQRLVTTLQQAPAADLRPAGLTRIIGRAVAHRAEFLERRWNRLVLTGLVLYGWALFVVVWPLLPGIVGWLAGQLALPWWAVVILSLGLWWSFCWVVGLSLLPLLQSQKVDLEEKVL